VTIIGAHWYQIMVRKHIKYTNIIYDYIYWIISCPVLDLHLEIDSNDRLRMNLCDKSDYFNFPIVNFPFICSNIPARPASGVYISQLVQYSKVGGSYHDLVDRGLLLTRKSLSWSHHFESFMVATMIWLTVVANDHGYVPFLVITTQSFLYSWLITGCLRRVTRRVSHVEQTLLTLPEQPSSPPGFIGFRVARYLVFYVMFYISLFFLFLLAIVLSGLSRCSEFCLKQ
jgi:hypothetical protein